ncbi:MAG: hypothetical protein LBD82_04355 [Deltaproteobacteria bacterium]|jgi:hypothetical protein|nr:hypothetical protein [Deltaproteobacteria bacterium]
MEKFVFIGVGGQVLDNRPVEADDRLAYLNSGAHDGIRCNIWKDGDLIQVFEKDDKSGLWQVMDRDSFDY